MVDAGQSSKPPEVVREVHGKVLTVAYEVLIPYVTVARHGEAQSLTGYLGDLWTILEQTLGFSSVYVRVDGNTARYMLQKGLADVYLQATVITTEENELYAHSQPVVTHWYQLYVRTGGSEVSADSYVRALSPAMWVMTLAIMIVMCVVLRAMVWLRSRVGLAPRVHSESISLGTCFLAVLGSLCSQGWQDTPRCGSLRVAVTTTLLCGYLLYNAYAAVLISYLASGHAAPFSDLQDLARKGSHILCVRNESYAYATLRDDPSFQWVLNKGPCLDASSTLELVEGLCEHNAAALEISSVMAAALDMDATPVCRDEVVRVPDRTQRATASLLLRKDFPYTTALDYMITRCRSLGVLDGLEKRYLADSATQTADTSGALTSSTQVSLEHVRMVLMAYCCFLAVPLLVLAGEHLVAWRVRRHQRLQRLQRLQPYQWLD